MCYIEFTNLMGPSAQNDKQFQGNERCDILTAVLMRLVSTGVLCYVDW